MLKKKILLITLLHLIVFILIQLFSFVRVLTILNYFLHTSSDDFSGKDVYGLAEYYNRIISLSHFKNPSCLEEALMLTFLMNRRNIPTEFCLGIAQSDDSLIAHAWLTFRGEVLGQPFQADEFVQVFSSSKISPIEVCRKF
jgi:hypothetical protein